jgi:hypothetical protein
MIYLLESKEAQGILKTRGKYENKNSEGKERIILSLSG